ncbi:MAG: uncharacterized membrane protein YuzA (DUF378 family) [Chlamydiales bacterium]|jgi:uncharacterized membrane protein YuzA (DUF378 family)
MKFLDILAAVILVVGLHWGLYGLFEMDVVASSTSEAPRLALFAYSAFGLAALYQIVSLRSIQRRWNVTTAEVR